MAEKSEKDNVLIFHTGDSHGPMETASGRLLPGQSLSVPKALADKLRGAYRHVRLASDVIPAAAGGANKAEKDKLDADLKAALDRVAGLEAQLTEAKKGKKADKDAA